MWTTLIFCGTAGLFLFWAISTLWHIRWVRQLPLLETLATAPGDEPEKLLTHCFVLGFVGCNGYFLVNPYERRHAHPQRH